VVDVVEVVDVVDVVDDSATTEVVVEVSATGIVVGDTPTVVVGATGCSSTNVSEQTNSCATPSVACTGATGNIAKTAMNETNTHKTRVKDAKRFLHCAKGVVCTHYKVGT
jgi:hypothetical protein